MWREGAWDGTLDGCLGETRDAKGDGKVWEGVSDGMEEW